MKPRPMLFRYISKELRSVSYENLLGECYMALEAYSDTEEYEHLVELYFSVISLLLKETDMDEGLIDMLEQDLDLLFPQLN